MAFVPGGFSIPSAKKTDRSHGLLTAVKPVYLEDPHWQSGFGFENDCAVAAHATLPPCPDPVAAKAVDGGLVFCRAEPFTVYGNYKCSTGGRPVSEAMTIATNRLNRNKEREVEKIFWTGVTEVGTVDPSLQGGNVSCEIFPVDITPDKPLTPLSAIAALESNIAECIPGGIGTINLNFGLLPYLARDHLLTEQDGNFYSPSGQLIIAGAGYPGSGPGNIPAQPGETWAFATGQISVFMSDIFNTPSTVEEAINRKINDISFWAEQTFSIIWECCIFAVKIALC